MSKNPPSTNLLCIKTSRRPFSTLLAVLLLSGSVAQAMDVLFWESAKNETAFKTASTFSASLNRFPTNSPVYNEATTAKAIKLCDGVERMMREENRATAEKILQGNEALLNQATRILAQASECYTLSKEIRQASAIARQEGWQLNTASREQADGLMAKGDYRKALELYNAARAEGMAAVQEQLNALAAEVLKNNTAEVRCFGGDAAAGLFASVSAGKRATESGELYAAFKEAAKAWKLLPSAVETARANKEALRKEISDSNSYAEAMQSLAPFENYNPPLPIIEELRQIAQSNLRFTPGQTLKNRVGMQLVYIPAGSFTMGSPETETDRSGEEVQHNVTLTSGFFMGVFEVTSSDWTAVMKEGTLDPDLALRPKDNVSWNDARKFCRRLSALEPGRTYRLPTEAEWEYACRAGTETAFHFGHTFSDPRSALLFSMTQPPASTALVGTCPPNAWGLHDMHGNLAEWCLDWRSDYATADQVNPTGPNDNEIDPEFCGRVIRGGSWIDTPDRARSACRQSELPVVGTDSVGFRVVLEAGSITL